MHDDRAASKHKVTGELANTHKALWRKYHMSSAALHELVDDIEREPERIKSLFGV